MEEHQDLGQHEHFSSLKLVWAELRSLYILLLQ